MATIKKQTLRGAKKSLSDMMKILRPYMPDVDVPPPPAIKGWTLPESDSKNCEENERTRKQLT